MPSLTPRIRIMIDVTEPTMHNGVWTLASFEWSGTVVTTRQEIEEYGDMAAWASYVVSVSNELRSRFDDWIDPLPSVERWHRPFKLTQERQFYNDIIRMGGHASGWFKLSDDEARTEKLLSIVSCERLNMPPLFLVVDGGSLMAPMPPTLREHYNALCEPLLEPLLEPRTADNNINPSYDIRRRVIPDPLDDRESHPGLIAMPGAQITFENALRHTVRHAVAYGHGMNMVRWSGLLDSGWHQDHDPDVSPTAEETAMSTTEEQVPEPTTPTNVPPPSPPEPAPAPDAPAPEAAATPEPEPSAEPPEGAPV